MSLSQGQGAPVQKQEQVPPTEQFRKTLYEGKKAELEKELRKYELYCVRSRDLEQLLNLHNFLMHESFREVKAVFEKFSKRFADVEDEEKEVYKKTFDLKFIDTALDFFNGFAVRLQVSVPESAQETKEVYTVNHIEVVYKGEKDEQLVIAGGDLQPVVERLNADKVPFEKLQATLLSDEFFVRVFADILYSTLMNHQLEFNTVTFSKDAKNPTYYNGSDFKKLVLDKTFDKYLTKLEDVQVYTSLVR